MTREGLREGEEGLLRPGWSSFPDYGGHNSLN